MIVLFPLILGLLSWSLGIAGIVQKSPRFRFLCSGLSLCSCCVSLFCCLSSIHHWIKIEDFSAILDCTGAYQFCASVLLLVTLVLNVLIFVLKPSKN